MLRVLKTEDFQKLGWVSNFCEKFFNSLIWLSPIWCLCIYVGPLWQFEHVLRQISLCSCILHHLCTLLHVRCLTKCPSDIFVLNWTQVSSNAWILSWLIMLIMFWSVFVVFTHYVQFVPQCHAMHTLSTPHASHATSPCITGYTHMHQHMLSTDTHMHSYLIHALCSCLLGLTPLACYLSFFTLFWVVFALF